MDLEPAGTFSHFAQGIRLGPINWLTFVNNTCSNDGGAQVSDSQSEPLGADGTLTASAGRHHDDTLSLYNVKTDHNSHETDVLYMHIPADMQGMLSRGLLRAVRACGHIRMYHSSFRQLSTAYANIGGLLEIWSPDATDAELEEPAMVTIHPKENTLVRFRGDAQHRVLKHYSATGQVCHLHTLAVP